jgi:uncharacterized protein (DUF736 family)
MSVLGTFTRSKDGGWIGAIRTLTMNVKVHLVPNDNRTIENAQAFRVLVGRSRVGDAWEARSTGRDQRDYLRVRLEDPVFAGPLNAALFWSPDGNEGQLVWNRRRGDS